MQPGWNSSTRWPIYSPCDVKRLANVLVLAMNSENLASHTLLTDLPPTRRQTRAAIAVVVMLSVAFVVMAPFSRRQAAALNAFFPSLDAIVLVTDLITAVLLYAQFSISRSRSLLVLASGYFFTALIVIPHALTFSGAFSPNRPVRCRPADRVVAFHLLAHRLRRRFVRLRDIEGHDARQTRCRDSRYA